MLQEGEVLGLAEEIGLVGGDGVDEIGPLVLEAVVAEQIGAIGVEAGKAQLTHAPAQATFDHQEFGGRQLDADLGADQRGNAAEIGGIEMIVDVGVGRDGLADGETHGSIP